MALLQDLDELEHAHNTLLESVRTQDQAWEIRDSFEVLLPSPPLTQFPPMKSLPDTAFISSAMTNESGSDLHLAEIQDSCSES